MKNKLWLSLVRSEIFAVRQLNRNSGLGSSVKIFTHFTSDVIERYFYFWHPTLSLGWKINVEHTSYKTNCPTRIFWSIEFKPKEMTEDVWVPDFQ